MRRITSEDRALLASRRGTIVGGRANLAAPEPPGITLTAKPWPGRALCAEIDAETFFPDQGNVPQSRRARDVCTRCPIQQQCLDFALEHEERYGIWGGLTEAQRRPLRMARKTA